jgi:hypothetical protein
MKAYVLSEGEFDREFLAFLVEKRFGRSAGGVAVLASSGKSNAVSFARSLLAVRGKPVALVVHSDTTDESQAASLANDLRTELAQVAPPTAFRVFLAVPEIEAWLFKDSAYLEHLLGAPLDPALLPLAEVRPKEALKRWFVEKKKGPPTLSKLMGMIRGTDPTPLLKIPVVRGLMMFLEENIGSSTHTAVSR